MLKKKKNIVIVGELLFCGVLGIQHFGESGS